MFSMMMQHFRFTSVFPFSPRSKIGVVIASAAASTSCTNTQPAKPSTHSGTFSGFWIAADICGTNTAMSSLPPAKGLRSKTQWHLWADPKQAS